MSERKDQNPTFAVLTGLGAALLFCILGYSVAYLALGAYFDAEPDLGYRFFPSQRQATFFQPGARIESLVRGKTILAREVVYFE